MTDEKLIKATVAVIKVKGELRGDLSRDLVRLEIAEDTSGLRTLVARFLAFGPKGNSPEEQLLHLDGSLDFGHAIEVSLGAPEEERTLFRGRISAIEADFEEGAEPEVVVFAEDALMLLRMTHRTQTWLGQSDEQIAAAIADLHKLRSDVAAPGPTYDVLQQWNMSDLAFLRERARRIQAELWIQEDTLHFKSRGNRSAPELTLVRGNHLLSVQLRADLAHQRTQITHSGYDAKERDAIDESAAADALGAEAASGRSGPDVLQGAFEARPSLRLRDVPLADAEARDWARAEMLRRARGFVTIAGVARGMPDLVVGSKVTLERVGGAFEGAPYHVTRVCHSYDLNGAHRTAFEGERATLSGLA